jgi:hypothetical protein
MLMVTSTSSVTGSLLSTSRELRLSQASPTSTGSFTFAYARNDNLFSIDVIHRLKQYLLANPDVQADKTVWLEGMGWDQNVRFPSSRLATISPPDFAVTCVLGSVL